MHIMVVTSGQKTGHISVRLCGYVRGDVHYFCERQPSCRRAATDCQRLDPHAEKGHGRFGVVQPELGGIS